jgi:hypothetical protein
VKSGSDYLGYGSLIYDRYRWHFDEGNKAITDEFDPLLGYIPRRDIFGPTVLGMLNLRSDGTHYKEVQLRYGFQYFNDAGGGGFVAGP